MCGYHVTIFYFSHICGKSGLLAQKGIAYEASVTPAYEASACFAYEAGVTPADEV